MTAEHQIYDRIMLDHSRNPRHAGPIENPTAEARDRNPLCGDDLAVAVRVADDRIAAVRCSGHACAVATAAGSMMADHVVGLSLEGARRQCRAFELLLAGEGEPGPEWGELTAFIRLRAYAARHRCALLPWRALEQALAATEEVIDDASAPPE